jgi:hypothetical protein
MQDLKGVFVCKFQFLDKDGPDFKRLRMDQVDVKRRDEEEKKLRQQDKKVNSLASLF